jgi:hypothetical protein
MSIFSKKVLFGIFAFLIVAGGVWYGYTSQVPSGPQSVWNNADDDMIKLDLVRPGVTVLPKFIVNGEARGPWFFEASFPVEVLDKDGKQIAQGIGQAQGEWMTQEFVPFRAEVNVGEYSGPATLVLRKDNPSGLPENDASLSVPIEVLDVQ